MRTVLTVIRWPAIVIRVAFQPRSKSITLSIKRCSSVLVGFLVVSGRPRYVQGKSLIAQSNVSSMILRSFSAPFWHIGQVYSRRVWRNKWSRVLRWWSRRLSTSTSKIFSCVRRRSVSWCHLLDRSPKFLTLMRVFLLLGAEGVLFDV